MINIGENNEILFKTNNLIMMETNFTSIQHKIFNKILFNCQSIKNSERQVMCKLTLEELKLIVKNNTDNRTEALRKLLREFMEIQVELKMGNEILDTTLVNDVKTDKETGEFEIYVHINIYNALIGYKEIGYSPLNLKLIRNTNGYYTQKLYELFRMWSGTKKDMEYTISYLKEYLCITKGTSYDKYANFKNKVIKPALKEICEKLNMTITFKENKVSRAVNSLTFIVEDREPRQYTFNNENVIDVNFKEIGEEPIQELLQNLNIKIAKSTTNKLKLKYSEELIITGIKILHSKMRTGKIKAPVKYLTGILENLHNNKNDKAENIKQLRFHNFEQREYDFDSLENALVYNDDGGKSTEELLKDLRYK